MKSSLEHSVELTSDSINSNNSNMSTVDGGSRANGTGTYDEEMVKPDVQASKDNKGMYNEEEYLAEVGELNCYCMPSRVYGLKDFFFRTLAWFLLNKEQLLGGFTG